MHTRKKTDLHIVDVSNITYKLKFWQEVRINTKEAEPYNKASAILGLESAMKHFLTVTKIVSKGNIKAFDNIEEAKEWLISQK